MKCMGAVGCHQAQRRGTETPLGISKGCVRYQQQVLWFYVSMEKALQKESSIFQSYVTRYKPKLTFACMWAIPESS